MTTELEQEFFKVFGIKPCCVRSCIAHYLEQGIDAWEKFNCEDTDCNKCEHDKSTWEYPEITDRKLLQLLCIYNDMQGCVELCIAPCRYEDTKEMILQFLIDEKTNITDYEKGTYMDVMTKQIQQLFKEEE